MNNRMVENLPLVVGGALRSPFDLATLTPEAKNFGTQVALAAGPNGLAPAQDSFAIGGGHVLHVLCDLTIAADTAVFGQNGPRVGSFDAGFGTGYLARVVGEKRAREIWFLCRRYSAEQAERWGLVNKVVPADDLKSEVRAWADEILMLSPTALKILKQSFNTDTEQFASVGQMAYSSLKLFGETPEAQEGVSAFNEKRVPEFAAYRGN